MEYKFLKKFEWLEFKILKNKIDNDSEDCYFLLCVTEVADVSKSHSATIPKPNVSAINQER